eukprot:comp22787_c0_seq2/m.35684 comp22787_c0_seq2/g.35684  ORF comp22787_c0_seq2/g.35684 comp22787_c0_seq2/m.35684 type:complete len:1075 (-) comp22787_c0_seq2:451-3675(-)
MDAPGEKGKMAGKEKEGAVELVAMNDEHGDDAKKAAADWVPSKGLTSSEADALIHQWGRNELVEKKTPKWLIYLMQLKAPMPIMIWLAIIIEAAIQNWLDMGILLFIQFANATIGWYEIIKAGNAVEALKASLKPMATAKRDGNWKNIDAALLVPGDLVLLAAGSNVPADCRVNHGQIQVDQSALTGESLPVTMYAGDDAKMGSTVTRGEVEGTVMDTGMNTFFGKTAAMLQGGDDLGNLQKMLIRIMIVLVVLSLLLCGIALAYLLIRGEKFKEALSFVVVLMVASIPIAIEIVCTTTLALGSRQMSVHGAIVTRLTAIEEMAGMNMLCSDKTGTLTLNKMVIQEDTPVWTPGENQRTILQMAALAAKWKEPPRDALDTLVLGSADLKSLDVYKQIDYIPFDPTLKRTEGTLEGPDGKVFKTTKGAPQIILELCWNKDQIHDEVWGKVNELGGRGIRSLAVARTDDEGRWNMLGMLTFLDPPRHDTKDTIEKSMELGVDVKMITGDHGVIAKECARMLGLGTTIHSCKKVGLPGLDSDNKVPKDAIQKFGTLIVEADGFAEVFPEHKFLIVEVLRKLGFACGMTGDGVNDAPALKRADVGIAVSGATDAARAAADIVLTQEGLSVIVHAIVIARSIFKRIQNFLNYRIAATLQLLCFFFVCVFAFHPNEYYDEAITNGWIPTTTPRWPDFFSLPVLMLMLITLLNDGTLISVGYDNVTNDGTLISVGYDNVTPSSRPEKWNLKVLFTVSIVLGAVAMLSSLLLVALAFKSLDPDSFWQSNLHLPALEYGQIITMIYLKVSLSDFLTLFSARTVGPFFEARPGWLLLGAACIALTISTILASVWPEGETDGIPVAGLATGSYKLYPLWIWIYCIIWWFIQDICKVITWKLLIKFDIFKARTARLVNLREALSIHEANATARASVGAVETKLINRKVENVNETIDQLQKQDPSNPAYPQIKENLANIQKAVDQGVYEARSSTGAPSAARASGGAPRKSLAGARASVGASSRPAGDAEAPDSKTLGQLEVAVMQLPEGVRDQVNQQIEEVLQVADKAAELTATAGVEVNPDGSSRA